LACSSRAACLLGPPSPRWSPTGLLSWSAGRRPCCPATTEATDRLSLTELQFRAMPVPVPDADTVVLTPPDADEVTAMARGFASAVAPAGGRARFSRNPRQRAPPSPTARRGAPRARPPPLGPGGSGALSARGG